MLKLIFGGFLGTLFGSSAALLACWLAVVIPAHRDLISLERTLAETRRNEPSATLQRLSADQVTKWAAALDDQHRRFAELQERGHEQELELLGPSPRRFWLEAVAVLVAVVAVVRWTRGADAAVARTPDRIVALPPVPASAGAALAGPDGPRGAARVIAGPASPPALTGLPRPAIEGPRFVGTVRRYRPGRGVGWIAVPEGPDVFFHKGDVDAGDRAKIVPGVK